MTVPTTCTDVEFHGEQEYPGPVANETGELGQIGVRNRSTKKVDFLKTSTFRDRFKKKTGRVKNPHSRTE
jgi:hypothetical protein